MTVYIGLDVHSKTTTFVAMDQHGTTLAQGKIATTREGLSSIHAKLQDRSARLLCSLETGTMAKWTYRLLLDLGFEAVVIDAREVRAKARRVGQKSDSRDAFELCDGLRRGLFVSQVFMPPPDIETLRLIISRRRHFVRLRASQTVAAKHMLRAVGLGALGRALKTEAAWKKLLAHEEIARLTKHLQLHFDTWLMLDGVVRKLDAELDAAMAPFAGVSKHLQTMPGVGPIVAATFVASIADPSRFATSGHAASYIGLVPSTYNSGESVRHGRITKRGNSDLRAVLTEAAHHAARSTHPLYPYFTRVAVVHGVRKATVTIAHRMARILFQMWKQRRDFDPSKLNVEGGERVVEKTVYYTLRKGRRTATGPSAQATA